MTTKVSIKYCEYLKEISCYNSNYYKLPFSINSCNVVLVNCNEDYNSMDYELGYIIDGEFEQCFIFACDYSADVCNAGACNEVIIIDSNLEGRIYT